MANGKWIKGLKAKTPLAEAARRVLEVRLEVVRARLPRAVSAADKDPEHVHQLRVGTRRAGAALRIFKPCLRGRCYRRARKALKKLREAAGAARDWDVFHDMLTRQLESTKPGEKPGVDFLLGYARGQRDVAQMHLLDVAQTKPVDVEALTRKTLRCVRNPPKGPDTLVDLARPLLNELLADLDKAVERDLSRYENLHQVRIAGKHLRYAMEVFESCFAKPFRDKYYVAVERLQEILGDANDSHVAAQRLEDLAEKVKVRAPELWRRYRTGLTRVLQYHRRRLPQQVRLFQQWWRQWKRSGAEQALEELLAK
jgi:CHAD domain-containing protein